MMVYESHPAITFSIVGIHLRICLQKGEAHSPIADISKFVKWAPSISITCIHVRLVLDKKPRLRRTQPALVQGVVAIDVCSVDLGSVLDQQLTDLQCPLTARPVKRCAPSLARSFFGRHASFQKQTNTLHVATFRRKVYRREPLVSLGMNVCPRADQ